LAGLFYRFDFCAGTTSCRTRLDSSRSSPGKVQANSGNDQSGQKEDQSSPEEDQSSPEEDQSSPAEDQSSPEEDQSAVNEGQLNPGLDQPSPRTIPTPWKLRQDLQQKQNLKNHSIIYLFKGTIQQDASGRK
jgi:hypothetical protein